MLGSWPTYSKAFRVVVVCGTFMPKAMYGHFENVKLCPIGGISTANARDYLNLLNVLCVDVSWLLPAI